MLYLPYKNVSLTLSEHHTDGTNQEFMDWIVFHASVCKHENVVHMFYCQTKILPWCLVLEAYSPGNLLHFLWTLRKVTTLRGFI